MDYIYKDAKDNKCIGEIHGVEVVPYYLFTIKIKNEDVWCHMERVLSEWCIHFIGLEKEMSLSHPTDWFWNMENLYRIFDDIDSSKRIAYAIKAVYEKYNK